MGGAPALGAFNDFWSYDPDNNLWNQIADFSGEGRSYGITFTINGKGYSGLGRNTEEKIDFWQYDPENNQWNQQSDFIGAIRNDVAGFSVDNHGFVGTGNPGGLKEFWEFIPQ